MNGPLLQTYEGFTADVVDCCTRILAACDNADLCFVGRSPENLFDFLSGLLLDSSWADRVQLFPFSWRDQEGEDVSRAALCTLHHYLEAVHLSPWHLAHRRHPVAFVDLVCNGETFSHLISFLSVWTKQAGLDWNVVRRKIRMVALVARTFEGTGTWRWQQDGPWARLRVRPTSTSVCISQQMWLSLGEQQPKVTRRYGPARWGSREAAIPEYDEHQLQALRLAW